MEETNYWQSLEELNQEPDFEKKKFDEFSEELPILDILNQNAGAQPTRRRDFLKYMGFSISAATLAASCEMPVRKAIPYLLKPEEITPGIANYYASTYAEQGEYCSILVKTREGRPIKIEGNPYSKITKGGTSARVQASILSLYNTNRLKGPMIDGKVVSWYEIDKKIAPQFRILSDSGKSTVILSSSIMSPATNQVIQDFINKYPGAKHVQYDPISYSGMLDANKINFGIRAIPSYDFGKADVIVSFAADFLGTWLSPVEFTKQYSANRKLDNGKTKMSRHFQFEANLSITGSNADIRVPLKPSLLIQALMSLYNEIATNKGAERIAGVQNEIASDKIKAAAQELLQNQGRSLVVCGINDSNVQQVVNGINNLLGNYGSTVDITNHSNYKQGNDEAILNLVREMEAGQIAGLIVYNCNPAYELSLAKRFSKALENVGLKINFGSYNNETMSLMQYACPDNHYLESWNDAEPKKGFHSLSQPAIRNIFNTRQAQESLLIWAQDELNTDDYNAAEINPELAGISGNPLEYKNKFYPYLQKYWEENVFSLQSEFITFTEFWNKALHDGVFDAPAMVTPTGTFTGDLASAGKSAISNHGSSEGMELVIYEKVAIGNGTNTDNPWLQEMPDPITKATWDNYILMSVKDATAAGLKSTSRGMVYKLSLNDNTVELPIIVQPGQAEGSIGVAAGYGRKVCGKAGLEIGRNIYPFIQNTASGFSAIAYGVKMEFTGADYNIAQTQTHHTINSEHKLEQRTIIKEGILPAIDEILEHIKEKRAEFKHLNEQTLYPGHKATYEAGHHWKMAIDLNSCTGCGSCGIACTVENNVPVVGKKEVIRAHEMHWMRIDRYYTGEDLENPDVVFQPMLCQHCDNAPCENVCPVSATNHSTEGLNQMAYNRCIGTRYCANNCPYKVRRFNWFDFMGADSFMKGTIWNNDVDPYGMTEDLTRMVLNPDVTVRSRGVIEKCSLCVQRIQEGKLTAKKEGRGLIDGDIKTACMQACPADAIVFGDYNDKSGRVNDIIDNDGRSYFVIEEVNTDPSIAYRAKIRNRSEIENEERRHSAKA